MICSYCPEILNNFLTRSFTFPFCIGPLQIIWICPKWTNEWMNEQTHISAWVCQTPKSHYWTTKTKTCFQWGKERWVRQSEPGTTPTWPRRCCAAERRALEGGTGWAFPWHLVVLLNISLHCASSAVKTICCHLMLLFLLPKTKGPPSLSPRTAVLSQPGALQSHSCGKASGRMTRLLQAPSTALGSCCLTITVTTLAFWAVRQPSKLRSYKYSWW